MTRRTDPARRAAAGTRRAAARESSGQGGFTVLEAIVAVAILGLAMVPLLSLQVQTSQGAIALERTIERRIVSATATDYLRLVDPVASPVGEMGIGGGWTLNWESESLGQARPAMRGDGYPTRHMISDWRVRGVATRPGARELSVAVVRMGVTETRPYLDLNTF